MFRLFLSRRWYFAFALFTFVFINACSDPLTTVETCLDDPLLCEARKFLGQAEWEKALTNFSELEDKQKAGEISGQECNIEYGRMLSRILQGVDHLDRLVEAISLFLGSEAPGLNRIRAAQAQLRPEQFGDLNSLVAGFIEPFEDTAKKIREHARVVINKDCVFDLYEGLPLNVGTESSLLYVSANLGYQWDTAVARTILAGVNAFQVVVNFLLAHNLNFKDLKGPLGVVLDEAENLFNNEGEAGATYINILRAAGVVFDRNPDLLKFTASSSLRMDELDNLLLEQYRAIYEKAGTGERGIIPDMVNRSRKDPDPSDNVMGWIDTGNNGAGADDKLIIGLRQMNLFSTVALTNNTGGIEITFNSQFGDIDLVIETLHKIILILGNQVECVEACPVSYPSDDYRPIGFEELNTIIEAVDLVQAFIPKIPEAVRFDFRAYFVGSDNNGPIAFRDLLPYWYDDDGAEPSDLGDAGPGNRPDVFMIEGEAAVSAPSVSQGDAAHFPTAPVVFGTYNKDGETLDPALYFLPADGISAADIGYEVPFPYIAWQNPSFNGMLLIDQTELPVAPLPISQAGSPSAPDEYFAPATQYSINKALNAYFIYFLDPDTNPFMDALESAFGNGD